MDNTTPAMKQFYELKKQVDDCLLFFRMWDFYELFWEDAHIAHRVLWISVTSRNKNAADPIPLAGIPYHAKAKYLPMLVSAWYKVAIAEQVSDPKLKWIVQREIVRIVTPATLELEWEEYSQIENTNILLSITQDKENYWMSFLEMNSNKWYTCEFVNLEWLKNELYKISPKEVILDKKLFWNNDIKEILEKKFWLNIYYFSSQNNPQKSLQNHFWVKNLDWFWLHNKSLATSSANLLLEYLSHNQKADLKFLQSLRYMNFDSFMNLDDSTIFSLDLIYNLSTKSSSVWTLLWVLNKSKTAAWNRYLREQIIKPLQNIEEIETRHNYIQEFYSDKILLDEVRQDLMYVADIDSILNRIALNRTNPRDLLNLKKSLESVMKVIELIQQKGSTKLQNIIKQ